MKYSLFLVVLYVSYISACSRCSYTSACSTCSSCRVDCPNPLGIQFKRFNCWTPAPIGNCMKCKCNSNLSVECLSCPVKYISPGSPCYMSEIDKSLQYPHCCPKTVCP
ncbi:uncharacterized protein LOC123300169 isoform X2 [Chrysoperla carnea]|uniref:uncharacterized protein LOC123300169 isoform X2 n=1 Tax=Chrysoperla carnea TaxID=189513 RepID=UPI001D08D3DB|nr:uncharacterized protein LOC123300169 isoform X2 [Chrysoperla carnea]